MTVRASLAALIAAPLLILPIPSSWAQDAAVLMAQGTVAAREQDWPRALELFERAAESGLTSGQLFYNIGVSRFRLDRLPGARDAFARAAEYPEFAGLAWYNIGLVELRLQRSEAARNAFVQVFETSRDPRLLALADVELNKLSAERPTGRGWRAHVYANAGVDTALIDPVDPSGDYRSDLFAEAGAVGSLALTGDLDMGAVLDLAVGSTRYARLSDYNFGTVAGDLSYSGVLGSWNLRIGTRLDRSTLGGTEYLQSTTLYAGARRPLGARWLMAATAQITEVSARTSDYAALDGSQQLFSTQFIHRGAWRTGVRYTAEFNDRRDLTTTTTFTSYSPVRHGIDVTMRRDLGSGSLRAGAGYRLSDYRGVDLLSDGTRIARADSTLQFSAAWLRPLSDSIQFRLDYGLVDNRSNISAYSYTQHLVALGLNLDL